MLIYTKETDKRGKVCIIEGIDKGNQVLSVTRFICDVQTQGTEKETQELADLIIKALKSHESLVDALKLLVSIGFDRDGGSADRNDFIKAKKLLEALEDK
jgi:hypothetical protein